MSEHKFYIAGVQHHELHKVITQLKIGDELDLVPEPTNKYDPNAIRIEYDGTMCGYVPKKFSAEVSALLESKEVVLCIITKLDPELKPWVWCEVQLVTSDEMEDGELDELACPICGKDIEECICEDGEEE